MPHIKSSSTTVLEYTQCKKQHPARVFSPSLPHALLSPCPSILRGVNSRGVGVRGSTMVHGYRMCLGGYAAWLPSVRIVCCSLTLLISLFLLISWPSPIFESFISLYFLFSFFLSCILYMVTAAVRACYQFIKERQKCAEQTKL